MDIKIAVDVNAPELAKAILALAKALGETKLETAATSQTGIPTTTPPTPPVQPPSTVPTSDAPVNQAPAAPPAVPTTQPAYNMDQLAVAATQLMDAGRQQELVGLLGQFGVQALTALPQEQYGAFATKLRELGAKI